MNESDPRFEELPNNLEAERAVLGAIMLDGEAVEIALEELKGDEFYSAKHRQIYAAMQDIYEEEDPIDIVTLTAKLQDKRQLEEVGGLTFLSRLASEVPTAANVSIYIDVVKEKHLHRLTITEANRLMNEAIRAENPGKVIVRMQTAADRLADKTAKKQDFHDIGAVAMKVFENVEQANIVEARGEVTGLKSGFAELDRMTAGFQGSDLIIVAARPSVGKTALALNIGRNSAVESGETTAIFSLEMPAAQLVQRMLGAEVNIDASKLKSGNLTGDDWEKLTLAIGRISEAPIYIDDSPGLTVREIRAKCRRLKKSKGLGLILIDYLQLLAGGKRGMNRQQEVSEISRDLKQLARELDVPVIALSQLSRGVEQRQDKRPMMSDLRESGSIEQDADIIAFLYRDDYYNKSSDRKNIIEIIIAKQRNGPTGTVELAFLKQYGKFLNLDRGERPKQEEMHI